MTKESEWAECVSVYRSNAVAMEVKSEDAVLYCVGVCNACRPALIYTQTPNDYLEF